MLAITHFQQLKSLVWNVGLGVCCLWLGGVTQALYGQTPVSTVNSSSQSEDVVLAKLGKQEIHWSDLVYRWRSGGTKVPELSEVDAVVFVEGVEATRKQRIVQAELDRRGAGASAQEIEQWIEERIAAIEGEKLSANDLAKKEGLSLTSWKRELRWQKSWEKYTRSLVTDDKLKAHYDSHPAWFDGTECEVFHIIRPLQWDDREGRDTALSEFATLAKQIRDKQTTFEEAAKKWSSGATAKEGGRLGWLTYQGPMHPSFVRAAFSLKEGDLSEPVETPHGVHLIYVRKIKGGALPFERVIENIRRSLLIEEFEKLASSYPKPPQLEWVYQFDTSSK